MTCVTCNCIYGANQPQSTVIDFRTKVGLIDLLLDIFASTPGVDKRAILTWSFLTWDLK